MKRHRFVEITYSPVTPTVQRHPFLFVKGGMGRFSSRPWENCFLFNSSLSLSVCLQRYVFLWIPLPTEFLRRIGVPVLWKMTKVSKRSQTRRSFISRVLRFLRINPRRIRPEVVSMFVGVHVGRWTRGPHLRFVPEWEGRRPVRTSQGPVDQV